MRRKLFCLAAAALLAGMAVLPSCTDLQVNMPKGPKGDDGLTAYEVWVDAVKNGTVSWKGTTELNDYFIYIKGEKGDKGDDGQSAYEIWKEYISTGTVADPHNSGATWDPTHNSMYYFYLFLTGADGDDGNTPYIGDNGNWFIGGKDSGVHAKGDKGDTGADGLTAYEVWVKNVNDGTIKNEDGSVIKETSIISYYKYLSGKDGLTPTIGENGNWFIGTTDTGVPAMGKDGKDGKDGLSAYEVWVKEVKAGEVTGKDGKTVTDTSKVSYYEYLRGKDGDSPVIGDNGNWYIAGVDTGVPARGKDGADGKDGNTPEVGANGDWFIGGKDTGIPATGKDGKDGVTPVIGTNGNWFIGGTDTGVPATGADGKDGNTPEVGTNGNWYIGGKDTGVPATGKAGADGLSAYELWKAEVAKGLDDPHNPGTDWDKTKTAIADFWYYLQGESGADGKDGMSAYELWKADVLDATGIKNPANGVFPIDEYPNWPTSNVSITDFYNYLMGADGVDGANGLSAYEIWKADVLDADGLACPDNGIYDITKYPKWPVTAVTLEDFYKYLKGADGTNGKDGKTTKYTVYDTTYMDNVLPGMYNVAPVRAVKIVSYNTSTKADETTYDYVNPFSGGEALIVTGPGPVIIPNCTVTFTNALGTSYTKTSDDEGYIYLTRDELPAFTAGNPSANANPTKPTSFKYGSITVTDPAKIAQTCVVAYQVDLEEHIVSGRLAGSMVEPTSRVSRIVEGKTEVVNNFRNGVAFAVSFPQASSTTGYGYYAYFNKADSIAMGASTSLFKRKGGLEDGGDWANYITDDIRRPFTDLDEYSPEYKHTVYGDGVKPAQVSVHHNNYADPFEVDYGLEKESVETIQIPEIRYMGGIDTTGLKGGTKPCTSYNDKKVYTEKDPETGKVDSVKVHQTNYELILGQTSFTFKMDWASFRQCYVGKATLSGDKWSFKRYDTLLDYLATLGTRTIDCGSFYNSGVLGGVKINNSVDISFSLVSGVPAVKVYTIRNVYNGFKICFSDSEYTSSYDDDFSVIDACYGSISGTFHYVDNAYVATPELNGKTYTVQAIVDGKSAEL